MTGLGAGRLEPVLVDVERAGDENALVLARGNPVIANDQAVDAREDSGGHVHRAPATLAALAGSSAIYATAQTAWGGVRINW